jgi:hypothetical protein
MSGALALATNNSGLSRLERRELFRRLQESVEDARMDVEDLPFVDDEDDDNLDRVELAERVKTLTRAYEALVAYALGVEEVLEDVEAFLELIEQDWQ